MGRPAPGETPLPRLRGLESLIPFGSAGTLNDKPLVLTATVIWSSWGSFWSSRVEAKPGGPQVLLLYATSLYGGKFFHDLAWTPNLAARLAEAGVEPERLKIPEP